MLFIYFCMYSRQGTWRGKDLKGLSVSLIYWFILFLECLLRTSAELEVKHLILFPWFCRSLFPCFCKPLFLWSIPLLSDAFVSCLIWLFLISESTYHLFCTQIKIWRQWHFTLEEPYRYAIILVKVSRSLNMLYFSIPISFPICLSL